MEVRALVFGRRDVASVACQVEDGEWIPMRRAPGDRVWTAILVLPTDRPNDRTMSIAVQAVDQSGRPGQHTIRTATRAYVPPVRIRDGSDAASIGAWPENGVFGTQLGPNRNGKPTS